MKVMMNRFIILFLTLIFGYLLPQTHEKWIVVTSINYPTKAIMQFAQQKDWRLVVVADKKTPKDWHLDNCDFLSIEDQENLPYKIGKLLPWNHYTRKNIGYLYAIEHGAQIIYDTDDDNILMVPLIPLLSKATNMLHCQTNDVVMNPYAYFGHPTIWPRGYPLENIQSSASFSLINKDARALVQQFVINGDPDVDAIYRLTKGIPYISFLQKPPICINKGTFVPYNSQGTIYHYEAFWGLVIPITTSFRVCDIWRGYWVQRLLWEIDACISFLPPAIVQERNAHNYFKDFMDELDLYTKSGSLVNFLKNWRPRSFDLVSKIVELTKEMIKQDFFKNEENQFVQAWLDDLQMVGYIFPQ